MTTGGARPAPGGSDGPVPTRSADPPFAPYLAGEGYRRFGDRVRTNPALVAGLVLLSAFVAVALLALLHFGATLDGLSYRSDWGQALLAPGPSRAHPFGTDSGLGIDVLDALWRATPNDLALVGGILLLASAAGVLLGAWAGVSGGLVDTLVVGASDLLVGVPPFFLVLVLYLGIQPFLAIGTNGLPYLAGLFGAVLWPYYARPVRAVAQRASSAPFAESARAAGAGQGRILFRHVLPNSLYPAFAQAPIDVYNVFFVLTVFTFLPCIGGGNPAFPAITIAPSPYFPEWGSLLSYGACYGFSLIWEQNAWWSYFFPGAFIVAFGLMVMLLCDGLAQLMGSGAAR